MPRFNTTVTAVDRDGAAVDLSAQASASSAADSRAYAVIEPQYAFAVVTKIESGHYRGGWSGHANTKSKDGKWNWEKIVPHFTLLNDNGTQINRQDFTLGVFEDNKFIRPDGNKQSPIMSGTQYLLTALGLFKASDDPSKFSLDVNFDLIADRVVRVKTGNAGYIKNPRVNLDGDKLHKLLTSLAGTEKYSFSQMDDLLAKFNSADYEELITFTGITEQIAEQIIAVRNTEDAADADLKLKNFIVSVYPVSEKDAAEHNWFYAQDTGSVFTIAAAWEQYLVADEDDKNYVAPEM